MENHILVMRDDEGGIDKILNVSYDGSKSELIQLINDNVSDEEIYLEDTDEYVYNPDFNEDLVMPDNILAHLGVPFEYMEFIEHFSGYDMTIEK